jgi:hypothetical protein
MDGPIENPARSKHDAAKFALTAARPAGGFGLAGERSVDQVAQNYFVPYIRSPASPRPGTI